VLAQLDTVVGLTKALGYTDLAASEAELNRVTVLVGNGQFVLLKLRATELNQR
jgi:hypothetical protein